MLANQPFDGVITGYTDYYFTEEPESKYHGEINEPVTAKQTGVITPHFVTSLCNTKRWNEYRS